MFERTRVETVGGYAVPDRKVRRSDYIGGSFDALGRLIYSSMTDRVHSGLYGTVWVDSITSALDSPVFYSAYPNDLLSGPIELICQWLQDQALEARRSMEGGSDSRMVSDATRRLGKAGFNTFDISFDEGINTGVKMPLLVAHRVLSQPNYPTTGRLLSDLSSVLGRPDVAGMLQRLAIGINGSLGSNSSFYEFPGQLRPEQRTERATGVQFGLVSYDLMRDRCYLPPPILNYLLDAYREQGSSGGKDGCPMRRRYGEMPNSLIDQGRLAVLSCVDIIGSAIEPDFVPSVALGDSEFGSAWDNEFDPEEVQLIV